MTQPLAGVFAPVTTPFGPDAGADPGRLASQIEIYAATDLAGFVLFGTSGEGPLLDALEEPSLLRAARRATPSDRTLIVQVGRESVRASRAAARRAMEAGADAVLCLPHRYYALDDEGIAGFFRDVAEAIDLPLLVYHIPQRSGVDLAPALIVELAREGTVRGIKDSAGDLDLQARLRRDAGPGFFLLDGKASVAAESLALGADGAILAVADAAPEAACDLFRAHATGDPAAARAIQDRLGPLAECLGPRFGVPGIKAALDLRGWPGGGTPRAPLRPLGRAGRVAIAEALTAAGVEIGSPAR